MNPRIIIKKKAGHGGHHGGAWKVAYADFVTAMMALFIVLWLLNTSKAVQEAVAGYFKDPSGTHAKLSGPGIQGTSDGMPMMKTNPLAAPMTKENIAHLKDELRKAISKVTNFDKLSKQIEMTVTSEGLRIELLETEKGTFFDLGRSAPNASGKELLSAIAVEIGKVPNQVSIEGHTDSAPYGGDGYSNWELSVDRANSARRIMSVSGLSAQHVAEVRGYADRKLRYADDPLNPGNRRISIIVQYMAKAFPAATMPAPALPESPKTAAPAATHTQ